MVEKWQKELIAVLLNFKGKTELINFLEGILTPKEFEELARRLQIIKLLKKKIPQHDIAKALGVGIATVTRGSREIKNGKFKYV